MNLYFVLAAFSIVSVIAAIYSFRQTQKFFNSTIDGFLHYPNGVRLILIPHIFITFISILTFYIYISIYENQTINLKIFINASIIIILLSLINFVTLFCLYFFLKRKLRTEGYIPLTEQDSETNDSEYVESLLSKEFNVMIRNFSGIMAVIYLFFFLFPTSFIDDYNIGKNIQRSEGRSIISDAKFYEGDNWFIKLVHSRRKYIQRYGYEKYIQIFGTQMQPVEAEIILYEKKNEAMEYEKTNIEREKEKILYTEFGLGFGVKNNPDSN